MTVIGVIVTMIHRFLVKTTAPADGTTSTTGGEGARVGQSQSQAVAQHREKQPTLRKTFTAAGFTKKYNMMMMKKRRKSKKTSSGGEEDDGNNNLLLEMGERRSAQTHVDMPPMPMDLFTQPQSSFVNQDTFANRTEPGQPPVLASSLTPIPLSTPLTSSNSDISSVIMGAEDEDGDFTSQGEGAQGGRGPRGRGGGERAK